MKSLLWKSSRCFWLLSFLLLTACGSPQERAQQHYEKGMALIKKGDDFAARLELLNAIKYKSDKIEAWRALAGVNERVHAPQYLFDNLRRIVELDPADLEARTKLAKMLLAGGAPETALTVLDAGGEAASNNPAALSLRAAILLKMKDRSAGIAEAVKARDLDPADVEAAIILAWDKLSKGDREGALQVLSAPAIASQNDSRVEQERALILAQKGDLGQAEAILHQLIQRKPDDLSLHDQLVRIYTAQQRYDDAERELRSLAESKPENTELELRLVHFLAASKGPAAARDELVKKIKGGGNVFNYQIALADLDFTQGKFEDSVATLKSLIDARDSSEHVLAAQAKLADFYLRRRNFPAAEEVVSTILKADARNTKALRVRAAIRMENGQFESAIGDIREALNAEPKSPELLLLLGLAYQRQGKTELAERQYADAHKSAAGNPAVTLQYVSFLQRQGRPEQAKEVLTDAVNAQPRSMELLGALAKIRLEQKDWSGTLDLANSIQALEGKPEHGELIRGAVFANQGKLDQAAAAFEAAHSAAPDAVQPVTLLATTYVRSGKSQKAEALLKEMLDKHPGNLEMLLLLGKVQFSSNHIDDAENSLKAAVEQHPKTEPGYVALADLYVAQKKYDRASATLRSALEQLPDSVNLELALAGVLIRSADYDGAMSKYEEILKRHPSLLVATNNLAALLLDHRTDEESLQRAYDLAGKLKNSNVAQFIDTLGWAQFRKGELNSAVETLQAAQAKLPNSASTRYHLAMAYRETGQTDKAAEELKAANQLEQNDTPLKQKIKAALNRSDK